MSADTAVARAVELLRERGDFGTALDVKDGKVKLLELCERPVSSLRPWERRARAAYMEARTELGERRKAPVVPSTRVRIEVEG